MPQEPVILELQEQLAFQEQIIDSLNNSLSQQQLAIARLQLSLELLAQKVKNMHQNIPSFHADTITYEKPPHY